MLPFSSCRWFFYNILFALLFIQIAHAQYSEADFTRYTVKDGLNDNYITCLQQDDKGYTWAGTDIGLNRFDGHEFRKFESTELSQGPIRSIKIFGKGLLGIVSRNGFRILNTGNLSHRKFIIEDSTAFTVKLNDVWDAAQLPDGFVALSTATGFYNFDSTGKLQFRHDAYFLRDIGKQRIFFGRNIFSISKTEFLVYNEEKGLSFFDAKNNSFNDVPATGNKWTNFLHPQTGSESWICKTQLSNLEFIFVYHHKDSIVYYDHERNLRTVSKLPFDPALHISWQSQVVTLNDSSFLINDGTSGFYLFHIKRQNGKITGERKKLMPGLKITCLFIDRDKRLWLGTNNGLYKQNLDKPFISSYLVPSIANDSLTGGFSTVFRYREKLYAGRYSLFNGMVILDTATMQPVKQINFFGGNNSYNEVLSMQMYRTDTIWVGTTNGMLWLDTKTDHYGKLFNEEKNPWAKNFAGIFAPAGKDGYAWLCSYLGGMIARYHIASGTFTTFTSNTKPALPFDEVKNIAYDSYGDVWIGGHSLTRWNNRLQTFDTLISVYAGLNKFYDDILTLSADDNGSLWLHNAFNGLLEYRIKEKKFLAYTMNDGLPSNILQAFSPVINGQLWIASNSNLTRFDTRTKKTFVFDQFDGLPDHRPGGRTIYFDSGRNVLLMCAGDYIVKIPLDVQHEIENSNPLLLEELLVDNKLSFFQPGDGIVLDYFQNNLSLKLTVIDFEKNSYQFVYRINNENWNNLGSQRTLILNNLQPGKYSIQLKAKDKSGREEFSSLSLVIKPPYWKSFWFLAGCILLITMLLALLYKRRIRQVKQRANVDRLLAQTEMKALHAQMNPHFIFNSLNSIREMILNDENKEASRYLSKFAQLIRVTLDQSGHSFISLRDTVDYLQRYIEMEKIRNDHFTYSVKIDEALDSDETMLPPMLIQPFIENAIWHGISASHQDIDIRLEFKKEENRLLCIIDDNGVGIDKTMQNPKEETRHNPVGIANIKNRIRLLNQKHNLQSSVNIRDKKNVPGAMGSGTLVTLYLPLETNRDD